MNTSGTKHNERATNLIGCFFLCRWQLEQSIMLFPTALICIVTFQLLDRLTSHVWGIIATLSNPSNQLWWKMQLYISCQPLEKNQAHFSVSFSSFDYESLWAVNGSMSLFQLWFLLKKWRCNGIKICRLESDVSRFCLWEMFYWIKQLKIAVPTSGHWEYEHDFDGKLYVSHWADVN